ncbi:MAG TPA: hypothetical protein VGL14_00435 [Methylomirabilota bacterium]|jgi:hypothetical protein
MIRLREALCPTCSKTVSVTYWPYNVALYTQHVVPGTNRDCASGLRPVETQSR